MYKEILNIVFRYPGDKGLLAELQNILDDWGSIVMIIFSLLLLKHLGLVCMIRSISDLIYDPETFENLKEKFHFLFFLSDSNNTYQTFSIITKQW